MKRLTLEEVKVRLKEVNPNIEILSDKYINAKTELKCRCSIDGYEWVTNWSGLSQGKGCHMCAGNIKYTYDEIKNYIESNSNCLLISDSYKNNESKLLLKCQCGDLFEKTFNDFRHNNKNCPKCSVAKRGMDKRVEKNEIEQTVLLKGYYLISTQSINGQTAVTIKDEENYKFRVRFIELKKGKIPKRFSCNNIFFKENVKLLISQAEGYLLNNIRFNKHKHPMVSLICNKGHEYETNLFDFNSGKRCSKCYRESNFGENHPNYNPSLTDEERLKDRYELYGKNMNKWAREVHKRCSYKCAICGSSRLLEAHHLEAWNSNRELRFDINNGVTLCKKHHKEFHQKYGYGNNTKEQFEEFASKSLS